MCDQSKNERRLISPHTKTERLPPLPWAGKQSNLQGRDTSLSLKQCPVSQSTSSPRAHDLGRPSQAFFLLSPLICRDAISLEIPNKRGWFLRMGRELWGFCQCRSNYLLYHIFLQTAVSILEFLPLAGKLPTLPNITLR